MTANRWRTAFAMAAACGVLAAVFAPFLVLSAAAVTLKAVGAWCEVAADRLLDLVGAVRRVVAA